MPIAIAKPRSARSARFISGLAKAGIELDRKVMADIAMNEPAAFKGLISQAQAALK